MEYNTHSHGVDVFVAAFKVAVERTNEEDEGLGMWRKSLQNEEKNLSPGCGLSLSFYIRYKYTPRLFSFSFFLKKIFLTSFARSHFYLRII